MTIASSISSRQKILFAIIGTIILPMGVRNLLANPKISNSPDMAKPGQAEVGKTESESVVNPDKKSNPALLMVIVIGNEQPIPGADVKIRCPAGSGNGPRSQTDQAGTVNFNCPGVGNANLSILATGYNYHSEDILLKEGQQRLTIKLRSIKNIK